MGHSGTLDPDATGVLLLGVVCVRTVLKPLSGNIYPIYAWAGEHFAAGDAVYGVFAPGIDAYRYSPIVAAGFVPFSWLPWGPGGAVFRLLGAALLLGGMVAWFRRSWPGVVTPAALLAALPLSLGSLNNGQANPHLVGLMVLAGAAALDRRWVLAGACVGVATLFKGYPVALGLLFLVAAPPRFTLSLLGTLAAGAVLPYLLQAPDYVTALYREWWMNMRGDDRTGFPLWGGYQDFHLLLRVAGWTVPREQYLFVQAGTGAACFALLAWQRWRGVPGDTLVKNAVTLGLCWMGVFGPAVETVTLILLAPVLPRELLDRSGQPRWARIAAVTGTGLFLAATVILAFPHDIHRPVISTGIQPLAASCELPLTKIRGQISLLPAGAVPGLAMALCGNGYVIPEVGGRHCFGATFDLDDDDPAVREDSHRTNLGHLRALLPSLDLSGVDTATLAGRVGFRSTSLDRLPLVGPLPDRSAALGRSPPLFKVPRLPGLHALAALGSRGMVLAPLMAELLAARIEGETLPLERTLVDALDPARFLVRRQRHSPPPLPPPDS